MPLRIDRVGEVLEGAKHKRKVLVSPEGVALDIRIANHGERLIAFLMDMTFQTIASTCLVLLVLLLIRSRANIPVGFSIALFVGFLVRNLYFLHFELAWQGRTPGKKICNLRVINRSGGELTPSAVIARNLTREVEVFLPLSLSASLSAESDGWTQLAMFGWALAITAVPFFNREHLRAGDLIAGTQVISMPGRVLLGDLTEVPWHSPESYTFHHEQLAIYGAFELQVLEEFLRRPPLPENEKLLQEVCGKICRKIGWKDPIPPEHVRRFLNDFYKAERAALEREQLFGRFKEDKTSGPGGPGERA